MKTIQTPISELFYDKDESILYINIMNDVIIDLKKIKDHFNAIIELTNYEKHLVLINADNYFFADHETLKYVSLQGEISGRIATAYYSSNLANRLTIHFFKLFHKPNYHVKLFKNKEEALSWLEHDQKNKVA